MDLVSTIESNLKLIALIRKKYPDETQLSTSNSLEAKYYRSLVADAEKAHSALANGGIASKVDGSAP